MSAALNQHARFFKVQVPCLCWCEIEGEPDEPGSYITVRARLCVDDECAGRRIIRGVTDKIQAAGGVVRFNVSSGRYLS